MKVQTRDEVLANYIVYKHLTEFFDNTLEILDIKGYEEHLNGLEDFTLLSIEGESLSIRFFTRDVFNHLLSDLDFLLGSTFTNDNDIVPETMLYRLDTEKEGTFFKYHLKLYFI